MARLAIFLVQMPGTIPDLVWWVLGGALTLIVAGAGLLARLSWQIQTLRLENLKSDLLARLTAIEKDIVACKRWQEDREP